jgi:V/A-type H+/Na+-transporting ATPase subunit I
MFRPVPMLRANILILDRDLASVIKEIGSLGIMHLVDHASIPGVAEMGWTPGQELEILSRYQSAKRQLDEIFTQTEISKENRYSRAKYDVNPLKDIDNLESRIGEIYTQIRTINEQVFTLRDRLAFEEDNLRRARNIMGMKADVGFMRSLENMRITIGYLPIKQLPYLEETVTTKFTVYIPLEQRGDRQKSVFFCLPGDSDQLENQLKTLGFEPTPLPEDCSGIPEDAIKELAGKIEEINASIAENENKLRGFGWTYRGELLRIRDHLTTNLDILKSVKSMGLSEHTALITGWIPKNSLDQLTGTLRSTLGTNFVLNTQVPEDIPEVKKNKVKVPVIYNNPRFLKPFESLVTTYGSPDYNEIDPSGIIGLAFLLMFGVMFGDLGHGLVLFLLGRFLQKRMKSAEVLGKIMTRAGASSMTFGLIFGSLFGHEFHGRYLPGLPLPFVPMENIDTFMAVAVAFGILFISIGLVINIINSVRSRDIEKGFLENHGLAGALFYWGAVALLIKYMVSGTIGIPLWGMFLILGVPLLVIFLKEPLNHLIKNKRPIVTEPITYIISSLIEVMETFISFLSNTVSFIRVAAFSLAHAALFAAIFAIIKIIKGASPEPTTSSILLSLAVEVGGNIGIIALEGLVVSIQSVRLIFYEFFSKFYAGEGEAFVPMRIGYSSEEE